jgi:hypothetical protein
MEATTTAKATGAETATTAARVEAAASKNNSAPRQCVRRGPMPRPSMRYCTPAQRIWPKNVPLRVLRNSGNAARCAALVATLTSIVGPGLRPRRRQHANMVTGTSLTPYVTPNTAPVGLGARRRSDVVGDRLVVHRQCHAHPVVLECFSRQQANPAGRIGFGRPLLRRASASAIARGQIRRGATGAPRRHLGGRAAIAVTQHCFVGVAQPRPDRRRWQRRPRCCEPRGLRRYDRLGHLADAVVLPRRAGRAIVQGTTQSCSRHTICALRMKARGAARTEAGHLAGRTAQVLQCPDLPVGAGYTLPLKDDGNGCARHTSAVGQCLSVSRTATSPIRLRRVVGRTAGVVVGNRVARRATRIRLRVVGPAALRATRAYECLLRETTAVGLRRLPDRATSARVL